MNEPLHNAENNLQVIADAICKTTTISFQRLRNIVNYEAPRMSFPYISIDKN